MALPLITKQIYDSAGNLAREVDRTFVRVQQFKTWLDTQTDTSLINSSGAVQPPPSVPRIL